MNRGTFARLNPFCRAGSWLSTLIPLGVLVVGLGLLAAKHLELGWVGSSLVLVIVLLSSIFERALSAFRHAQQRRKYYQSGDSARAQAAAADESELGMVPPRHRALALAGTGDFAAARRALMGSSGTSDKGEPLGTTMMPAWARMQLLGEPTYPGKWQDQEDQELSLCVRIVILAFEGESNLALSLCRRLAELPLGAGERRRTRRRVRREGIIALARAVSGTADEGDYSALSLASTFEPALYWACRYGAAVACCVKDEPQLACTLVKDAPRWPKESRFRLLHARIVQAGLGRRASLHAV